MSQASGRPSIWERKQLPPRHADGSTRSQDIRKWLLVIPMAIGFALTWSVVFLSYLLPPADVYGNLIRSDLTHHQAWFIGVATMVLTIEFLFARHLFCRYACAVGLFQSLAWMSNRQAMVVGFDRRRAAECERCYDAQGPGDAACEAVCPMRLRPRTPKHKMFTCTQCGQCTAACHVVQQRQQQDGLLEWVSGEKARQNEATLGLIELGESTPGKTGRRQIAITPIQSPDTPHHA